MSTGQLLTGTLILFLAGACSDPRRDSSPRMTAMLVVAYSQMGSAGPLFELLDPEDRAQLEKEASRLAATGLTVLPQDLLMIRLPPRDIATGEPEVKTLEEDATNLHLQVDFGDRSGTLLHLRKSNGKWRLKLPVLVKP